MHEREERAKVLSRETIFRGRVISLEVEEVDLPGGRRAKLEIVSHPEAAAIVPLLPNREVVLLRQYRHAVRSWLLEVPAGKLDPGESASEGARRECGEEAGFLPGRLETLGFIWTTPGFTNEKIWLFLALDLAPVAQKLDADEVLAVERMPLAEALAAIQDGRISDAKSIAALTRAAAALGVS